MTISWLRDQRSDCWSAMSEVSIGDYLQKTKSAREQQGNLTGQRDLLATTAAKRIRARMVSDIVAGTVLPPIVLGSIADAGTMERFNDSRPNDGLLELLSSDLSIIDGMQRTGALLEAIESDGSVSDRNIRVEVWFAQSVTALIYRMMILNTAQMPWNLKRQLEVVYASVVGELEKQVPSLSKVPNLQNGLRRSGPAQLSEADAADMFIAFTVGRTNYETKDQLSEDFARLDVAELTADRSQHEVFYRVVEVLCQVDIALSSADSHVVDKSLRGATVFGRSGARIGFVVAASKFLSRRATGAESRFDDTKLVNLERNVQEFRSVVERVLEVDGPSAAEEFLDIELLNTSIRSATSGAGQVGREERAYFYRVFLELMRDEFEVHSMRDAWQGPTA